MKYKEYLELLAQDINMVFEREYTNQRDKEHSFRVQILIFHLHADYLLSEIIKWMLQSKLSMLGNRNSFNLERIGFMEKLKISYATGNFDEDFFTALRILNKVRNSLSHNLIINLNKEEDEIRKLKLIGPIIREECIKNITILEHLLFSTFGYINILAEYLHNNLKKEGLTHIMSVMMPQRINIPNTPDVNERPVLSVVERVNLEAI